MESQKVQVVHLQMVKDSEVAYKGRRMDSPEKAAELVHGFIGDVDRECLVVCAADAKMHPTCIQIVGIGAVNHCLVSIPEIFKIALLSNAANILLFHRHPSGDTTPSREDIEVTLRVKQAGELLGIPLSDHIILGDAGCFYSFLESGRLRN